MRAMIAVALTPSNRYTVIDIVPGPNPEGQHRGQDHSLQPRFRLAL